MIELVIAIGCSIVIIAGISNLVTVAVRGQRLVRSQLEAISQRSEIRARLMKTSSTGSTCLDQLGLPVGTQFNPASDLDLLPQRFSNASKDVQIDRIFLTQAKPVGARGIDLEYSSLLRINQSVVVGTATQPLAPSSLGVIRLLVSHSGIVLGCNWDIASTNAISFCQSTPGLQVRSSTSGAACSATPVEALLGACPGGSVHDPILDHCIPSNEHCYMNSLGNDFDGNRIGCSVPAGNIVIRYPTGYSPPPAPSLGSTTSSPPPPCGCGQSSIPAGSAQLCIRGYTNNEGFGNYDDMFDVKVCNSVGNLEDANPARVFSEMGRGQNFGWRLGSCTYTGGNKTQNGRLYAEGSCH